MEYLALYNDWAVIVIMMAGFYIMIARHNLVKKILGLSIFQTGIFYFYVGLGKVDGATAPIFVDSVLIEGADVAANLVLYSNPLPHVLILTAIVVSVATMAVGLALIVRIYEKYGSIEEDEIHEMDLEELAQK
ncbi:MAG: multicomponent Na+:H+ antiporter subunit C [Cellvibrionaceae bacterium]|jgi:multicomponent Na+:H+ antiporter subunit C